MMDRRSRSSIRGSRPGRIFHPALLLLLGMLTLGAGWPGMIGPAHAGTSGGSTCSDSISDIYDRVSPTVVSIMTRSINPYQPNDRVSRSLASGVIVDAAGIILTNSHVVFGRQAISVTLDDGTRVAAELVGADPIFDLAVLRIQAPKGATLPVAILGESADLRVGDEVLAIGNPLGLDQTLTRGVVSAVNRILPDTSASLNEPMIQTDAAINPGNSGGPLIDRCGRVIGLTTAILPDAQNIGFAIPIDLVKPVLASLLKDKRVIRPWVGVQGQLVPPALHGLLRMPLADGFLVETVEPGSPADRFDLQGGQLDLVIGGQAFLLGGDIITQMNGKPVDSPARLVEAMRSLKVGDQLRLTIFRENKTREVEFLIPERPLLPNDLPGRRSGELEGAFRRMDWPGYRL